VCETKEMKIFRGMERRSKIKIVEQKLKFKLLRLFPGENVPAEVSVGACLLENWCL